MSLNIHKDDLFREGSLIGEKIGFEKGVVAGISRGRSEGLEQGLAQGLAQGFSEGSRQKAIETAKNLLALGLSVEDIAQATGLSKEEVESV